MIGRPGKWTPEREERLRVLWGQMATNKEMRAEFGVSAPSIHQKAHALGLGKRTKGPEPKPESPNPMPAYDPFDPPLSFEAPPRLRDSGAPPPPPARDCQWPLSNGYPWKFCGEPPAASGRPYCAKHHRIAYTPLTAWRQAQRIA